MNVRSLRRRAVALSVLLLACVAASCSKNDSFDVSPCDNEGSHLIAFASDRGHAGQHDLYLFDADQSGFRLLKNLNSPTASDSSPTLSSDGQLIAFVSARGTTGTDLYVYERISCAFAPTTGINSAGNETEPRFTGDTRRLAFVRDTLGHRRIRLVNGGSLAFEALPGLDTLDTWDDWSPAPDRTGDNIVFVSDRSGEPHLYLYQRSTRQVDSLPEIRLPGVRDLDPTLTPDAHWLCFASDRPGGRGGFDLYLFDLTVTSRQFVDLPNLNTSGNERRPTLGAAGTFIAFQSDSSGTAGRDVRYYSRSGAMVATPSQLAGAGDDIHPSIRIP